MNILTKNSLDNLKLIENNNYKYKNDDKEFIKFIYDSFPLHIKRVKHKMELNQKIYLKNSYIPPEIENIIHNNKYILYDFTYIINDINCKIKIYSIKKININKYKKYIYSVLFFFIHNKKQLIEKELKFTFYLNDIKKYIQKNECINNININSGYTIFYPIKEVVIYRKEEWLKVFIHECMHYFKYDFHGEPLNKNINTYFNIDTNILLFESYTEFYARIINGSVIIFNEYIKQNKTLKKHMNHKNYKLFELKFIEFINNERTFSILQMKHILKLININYKEIPNAIICNKINETTNSFCYYYITSIYLYNYNEVIKFCKKNNINNYVDFNNENTFLFTDFTIYLIKKNINIDTDKNPNNFNMALYEISF